jgi:uncharacterized repeat protein (TIGR01451 family)
MTDGVLSVVPGTVATYTIIVSNAGPGAVVDAPFTDLVPAAPTISTAIWTCVASPGSSCGSAGDNGSIQTMVSLLSGGFATITINALVARAAGPGTLSNTATVAPPPGTSDPNPGNNSATDVDTLTPQADLSILETGPDTLVPLLNATYTLTAVNAGPSVGAVTVAETLPAGVTFALLAAPFGWSCTKPPFGSGGTVSCSIPALGVGGPPAVFTIVVTVDHALASGTVVSNTATISSTIPDPNPLNNSSTATGTVNSLADVSLVKTSLPSVVSPGQPFTYQLVVTNNGPVAATVVTLVDPLPPEVTFLSATSTLGFCSGTRTVTCLIGPIVSGESVTVQMSVSQNAAAGRSISNTATVTASGSDPVTANNSSTVTTLVATNIPTLSEWALALFAAALAGAALFAMRHRS